MKLNLGCGDNKISDCINIDINSNFNPDLVCDITNQLPFETDSVDVVYLFHTIEHLKKSLHKSILTEIRRVLKLEGIAVFSYPEFKTCYKYWETNYRGLRDFWEATIYGRQSTPFDYHVAIMDTNEFVQLLLNVGYEIVFTTSEPGKEYNTFVVAKKVPTIKYDEAIEDVICQIMQGK